MQKNNSTRKMVFSALFLALCMLLPFLTGQIPQIGGMLLPMHIPVLLCGFICGPWWGMLVGIAAPVLRSVIFGMPPMVPTALSMAFELAAYGCLAGLLHGKLGSKKYALYLELALTMLGGRLVWALASWVIYSCLGSAFTFAMVLAGGFVNAWPGILLQMLIIPPLVRILKKVVVS